MSRARPKSAPRLKTVPVVPPPETFPVAPIVDMFGGTGASSMMEMRDHTAGDLLGGALGVGPWLVLGDGIRTIANELHFVNDSFTCGNGSDFADEIVSTTLESIEDRLRVLAEVSDRRSKMQRDLIKELESEIATIRELIAQEAAVREGGAS